MIQNYLRLAIMAIAALVIAFPSIGHACSMTSNPEVTIALGNPAPHTIVEDEILEGTPTCPDLTVTVFNTDGTMRLNPVVDCNDVGDRLLVMVSSSTGNSVWSYVTIVDNLRPVVNVMNITVTCVDDIEELGNAAITATDNCTAPEDLEFRITSIPSSVGCANGIAQTFIRSIFVIDESGNRSATVPQTITVERVDIDDVVFPPNRTFLTSDTNLCPADFGTPAIEFPTVNGNSISSICKLLTTVTDEPLSTCGSSRKFLRNYRVLDCCTNETRTGFQVIEIMDDEAPQILTGTGQALQDTINAVNQSGDQNCTGTVFFQPIVAQDACGSDPLTYRIRTPFGMINTNGGFLFASFPLDGTTFDAIYEVSDACGNTARDTVVVRRDDNLAPVAICDEITTVSLATASTSVPAITFDDGSFDNCFIESFTVRRMGDIDFEDFVTFTCDDVGDTVLVEFRVIDFDGNFNICMVSVIVEDKSSASINPLPNLTFSCLRNPVDTFFSGVPTVNEVCPGSFALDTIFNDDSMLQCQTGIQKRTFVFTNAAGQMIMTTQMINYVDSGSFTVPTSLPDTTIDCTVDPLAIPVRQFSTDCDVFAVNTSFSAPEEVVNCSTSIFRVTYSYISLCGNRPGFTLTQNITSIDNSGPVFDQAPGELDATFACALPAVRPVPTATDNCNGAIVTLVDSTSISNGVPGCPDITFTFTYTAQDLCGNVNPDPFIQVIRLRDTIAPTFAAIDTFVLACKAEIRDTLPAFNAVANGVSDNCMGMVDVRIFASVFDTTDACVGSILRTYIATDVCGNTSTANQIISYDQMNRPLVLNTLPAVTNLECYDEVVNAPLPSTQSLGGSFCGGGLVITATSTEADPMTCPATVLRTYTVEDDCGNMGMITQSFTFNDVTDPIILGVVDLNFQCQSDVPSSVLTIGDLSVSENCYVDTLIANDVLSPMSTACSGTIVRTYTAVDLCGNTGTAQQSISWNGVGNLSLTTPPTDPTVFTCYQDILDVPQLTDPTFFGTGFCGTALQIDSVNHTADPGCSGQVLRGYFLQDGCGNRGSVFQVFNLNDTVAPVFTSIADIMVVCAADVPGSSETILDIEAMDNCMGRNATVQFFSDNVISAGPCTGSLIRNYFATDGCGNVTNASQTISYDQTGLTLTFDPIAPVNNLECYSEVLTAPNPTITLAAGSGCGGDLMITNVDVEDPPAVCPATVLRTFTVEDACGNTGTVSQSFTYNDLTNPVISGIDDIIVQCQSDVPSTAMTLADITASDNCVVASLVANDVPSSGNTNCSGRIIRFYTATDDCGNTARVTQAISWNGVGNLTLTTPPTDPTVFTCYQDILDVPQLTDPTFFGTGFCGTALQIDSVNHTADPGCSGQVLRGYFLQDGCGNRGSVFQVFNLNDTVAPVFTSIADIMVVCAADVPGSSETILDIEAMDNCMGRNATVQFFSDNVISAGPCTGSLIRNYFATDGCGNVTNASQTISYDQTGLTLTFDPIAPVNNLECYSDVLAAPNPTITLAAGSGCGGDLMVSNVDVEAPSGICPDTVLRTYTVVDDCGNSGTATQSFIYNDVTDPIISGVVAIMVQCQSDVPTSAMTLANITVSDNCGVDTLIVSEVANPTNTNCSGSIIRSYAATDGCGNTVIADQSISWDGVGALTLITPPANTTVFTCYQDILDAPQITDPGFFGTGFCGTALQIDSVNHSADPGCSGQVLRGYFLQDGCGNQGSVFQMFMLNDTTGPVFSGVMDTMIQCETDLPSEQMTAASISAFDSCAMMPISFTVSTTADPNNSVCGGFFTRVYLATDQCGNVSSATQTITYGGGTLVLNNLPEFPDTFLCYQDVLDFMPTYTPSQFGTGVCGTPLSFVGNFTNSANPGCAGTVTRTFMLQDSCGNIGTATQLLVVKDTVGPELAAPRDRTIFNQCEMTFTNLNARLINAGNNACNNDANTFTFTNDSPFLGGTGDPNSLNAAGTYLSGLTTITFTATDLCGNTDSVSSFINIVDNESPTIGCSTVFLELDNTGVASITEDSLRTFFRPTDNCEIVSITLVSPTDLSFDCSDDLPLVQPYLFEVIDRAGNSNIGGCDIIVQDPPDISCRDLDFSLRPSDTSITITLSQVLSQFEFSDNCTPVEALEFDSSFPITYECSDFSGPSDTFSHSITIFDTDNEETTCTFNIIIANSCTAPPMDPFSLAGRVDAPLYGGAMDQTIVNLDYNGGSVQTLSDADGYYSFANVPPGAISLSAKLPMRPTDRVTTYDMLRIGQHILGTDDLDSPLLILAADVNKSGSVSAFDLTAIRRVILGQDAAFAGQYEATTFGAYHPFSDGNAPWSDADNWGTSFPFVSTDMMSQDISLVKLGDVNPTDFLRPRGASVLELEDAYVNAGETVDILVRNDYQSVIAGLQLSIIANGMLSAASADSNVEVYSNVVDGANRIIVLQELLQGEPIMTWSFTPSTSGLLSELIQINGDIPNESYAAEDLQPAQLALNWKSAINEDSVAEINAFPNPFDDHLSISAHLTKAGKHVLRVTDVTGRSFAERRIEATQDSWHNLRLNATDWSPGAYMLTIEGPTGRLTKRVVLQR
jgi:hypothetical protein